MNDERGAVLRSCMPTIRNRSYALVYQAPKLPGWMVKVSEQFDDIINGKRTEQFKKRPGGTAPKNHIIFEHG